MKKLFTLSLILGLANLAPLQGQCYTYTNQADCEAAGCTWYGNYCGDAGGGGSTSGIFDIHIYDGYYSPVDQYINVGDTVKWTNYGSNTHTATANDGSFDSGALANNQSFMYIFTVEGNYDYYCTYHSSMTGTINVGSGGGGGTSVELTNGVEVTGISGSAGDELHYYLDVPVGQDSLLFEMDQSGGSGDADLYVKAGSPPTTSTYDCRPYSSMYPEECEFSSPTDGTWYAMVRGYNAFSGVSLLGEYWTSSGGTDYLDITYPDSTTEWDAGSTYTITWDTNLPSMDDVSLELYKDGSWVYNIIGSTDNDGSYTFYVPDTVSTSDDYQIFLMHNNSGAYDWSEEFTIYGTPEPEVTFTAPVSGTVWTRGTTETISWTDSNLDENFCSLYLDESSSMGSEYLTITNMYCSDSDDDYYSWPIPSGTPGGEYVIRIAEGWDATAPAWEFYSDPFEIEEALTMGINYPASGDTIHAGTTDSIHWYLPAANVPCYVDVNMDYYTAGSWYTYGNIEDDVFITSAEWVYDWDVSPSIQTGQYKIWLYSTACNVNSYGEEFVIEGVQSEQLTNGEEATDIYLDPNEGAYYYINVPADQDSLNFYAYGGTGDVVMYTNYGSMPTLDNNTCHSDYTGNEEDCEHLSPDAGLWWVWLVNYSAAPVSGLTLIGEYSEAPLPVTELQNGVTESGLSGAQGDSLYYLITVPDDQDNLKFQLTGGTGDADMMVQYDNIPTPSSNLCISTGGANEELCEFDDPDAGDWYVIIWGHTVFSGADLTVSYSQQQDPDYSLDFGSSGSAEVSDNFGFTSGEITVEMFIKLHTADNEYEFFWIGDHGTGNNLLGFGFQNSNTSFFLDGIGQLNSGYSASVGDWHHVAAVYDGSEMRLYMDGTLQQSSTPGAAFSGFSNQQLEVGWSLDGLGDMIRISDIARYDSEFDPIDQDWSPDGSTILQWNCDENGGTTLNDNSGNNYTGSFMTGTPTWSSDTPLSGGGGGAGVPNYISVSSPAANDNWSMGSGESIQWSSSTNSGDGFNVDIELWLSGSYNQTIVDNYGSGSSGDSYWWSIPTTLTASTNYEIKVIHSDGSVNGFSGVFEISSGGGAINGTVTLNEDFTWGNIYVGAYSPGTSTVGPWDIYGPNWGEDPPFSNIGFQIQSDQITPNNGPYAVAGFFDANNNMQPDSDEPTGMVNNIYTDLTGNAYNVNLTLHSGGGGMGMVFGDITVDTDIITEGDAIIGLFWPGDDETDWNDVTDTENLGDISGIDTLEFDFESSLIDDDSGYHIAAFVDYNGNEYPDDIEPYITSGDITVSGGEADVGSIHIAYEYTGHLYTEASELDLVAVSGETVEFYLGIMNDGSGAVLIDNVTTDHSEISVDIDWPAGAPMGVGPGGMEVFTIIMDFSNAGERSGDLTISLLNGDEDELVVPYSIEVYDAGDATITTDTVTVSGDGTYNLDDTNTNFDFTGVSTGGGVIAVTIVDGQHPPGDSSGVAQRFWEITAGFDFTSAEVCFDLNQLSEAGLLDGITDFNSLVIYYRPSYSQDDWVEISGSDLTHNESDGTICASDVSDFSQWTVGGGNNFLPSYTVTTNLESLTGWAGQGINVSASISDIAASFITTVEVNVFKPGESSWLIRDMTDPDGDMTYEGLIPDDDVTPSGLLAAVVVYDSWNRVSSSDTVNIPVSFNELNIAQTSANQYKMISVPGNLDDKSIAGVVGDELGVYDNTVYRILRYDPQSASYNENSGQFAPTAAYWIITASAHTLQTGSGVSTPLTDVPTITLQPGWNMVATPYAADTYLSAFEVQSGSVETKVYRYTGNGYTQTTQLQPWNGYWLFVNEQAQIKVKYPRPSSSKTLAKAAADISLDFSANVKAHIGNARDDENEFGLFSEASDEWDELDSREPPVIGDYISLAFDNRSWTEKYGLYNTDIRSTGNEITEWPLIVTTNKYGVVHLDFEWLTSMDPGWQVVLVDRDLGLVHNVTEDPNYSYASTGNERERAFIILAGNAAQVDGQIEKYEIIPDAYVLGQNVPNPFNPVTSIPIVLGEDAYVTLSVFNVRGEEVSRILDRQSMTKGHHNTIWVGKDQRGIKVPTGVYLYRLEAVDAFNNMLYQNTRKMILVK